MPTLEEVHGGLGSSEATFGYDRELWGLFGDFHHLLFFRKGKLKGTTVILAKTPSSQGITIAGYGLGFWLGVDNDGPIIENRTYIAGNNQLSNGDFETLDALAFPDLWDASEGSKWAATSSDVHSGSRAVHTNADMGKDDVLKSEPRDVTPGALVRTSGWFKRLSGVLGRVRLRTVYEGRYDPADLLDALAHWTNASDVPGDLVVGDSTVAGGPVTPELRLIDGPWSDTSEFPGDIANTGTELHIGPCTQKQAIENGGFESGDFSHWDGNITDSLIGLPDWLISTGFDGVTPRSGTYMAGAYHAPSGGSETTRYLGFPGVGDPVATVVPGERWALSGFVAEGASSSGSQEASLLLGPDRAVGSSFVPTPSILASNRYGSSPLVGVWKELRVEYDIPPDVSGLVGVLFVVYPDPSTDGGYFFFDDITLSRIRGNTCQATGASFSIVAHDTYEVVCQAFADPGMAGGEVVMSVTMTGAGKDPVTVKSNPVLPANTALIRMTATITPDDGYTDAFVTFDGADVAGDTVVCNYPVVTRTKGNTAVLTAPTVAVTPERPYQLSVPVTAAAGCTGGDIRYAVLLQGAGRPDQVVVSGTVDYQQKTRTLLQFDFTPPSGYDSATVSLVWTDVLGGPITANAKPTLACTDTSTSVVDTVIGPDLADWTQFTQDSVAPAGTQKVHIELVAEANGDGWLADDIDWHRREAVTASAQIVDDLLRDPDGGNYLLNPGTIHPLPASSWDWLLHNVTNQAALGQFLQGGRVSPVREFRINPDGTVDVGLATELSVDRSPAPDGTGFIFTEPDLLLLDYQEIKSTVEDRLTRVKVIGAALQRIAPLPDAVIVGSASTTIPDARDWNNNPVSRSRIVEDSSVTYQAFGDGRAADELAASLSTSQVITVDIADWAAWGDFGVGDWVPAYKPEALLEDTTNPMTDRFGRTVYPALKRVLSRKTNMARGDGWEIGIRAPDGTIVMVPPSLVRWDDATKATLELGDVRPNFENDPQGPAAGIQFARWRAMAATR